MKKIVECPVLDWTCPYYHKGECQLENAKEECDAFYGMEEDEDEEEECRDNYYEEYKFVLLDY